MYRNNSQVPIRSGLSKAAATMSALMSVDQVFRACCTDLTRILSEDAAGVMDFSSTPLSIHCPGWMCASRAVVMASQGAVDLVTWFAEDTPEALIARIRPDILVKGGDYDMAKLPETRLVESWGGRAQALPFVSGYSTTGLVKKIRAQSSSR